MRIKFLDKCKRADLIPKFLKFRIPTNGCFDDKSVHDFQRRLLHRETIRAKESCQTLQQQLNEKRASLRDNAPEKCLPSILLYTRIAVKDHHNKQTVTHNKKVLSLSEEQERPLFDINNTVITCDLDFKPPSYVIETLALGPKNAVLNPFDPKDIFTELDLFMEHCEKLKIPDDVVTDINIKTLDYVKRCKKLKSSKHIRMTKKYLKDHDLLAVPFDKGIGICLMKKDMYHSKMDNIINLPQFEKVTKVRKNQKHPLLKEEERVQNTLKKLLEEEKIGKVLYDRMKPMGSQPARLYGLAKVHKNDTPIRPVLSMPGSAYFGVASQVAFWLSLIPECQINSSTKSVCDSLHELQLDKNEELVSFDVSSLYTNVPVREAIQTCADLIYNPDKNYPRPPVSKETFVTLAEIASCDVVMSTHAGYYRQIEGLAMGSPPAPHLANGWMSQYDETIKGTSKVYTRYMDDILCDIDKDAIDAKLTSINSLHPFLKFTIERQENGEIPFLDMKIINTEGKLSSTWYSKPSNTGLMMNFHALAPKRYKRSVVSGYVHRIYRACSSWKNFHESMEKAKDLLTKNQYPSSFFEPIIHQTLTKIMKPDSEPNEADEDETSENVDDATLAGPSVDEKDKFKLFVQYRGKSTDQFAKSLHNCQAPCRVIMTLRKLKTVMPSLKPPVEKVLRSGVVYKIECPRCQACYVGQTGRHLTTRFKEHQSKKGPVKTHFSECNMPLEIDMVEILASSQKSEQHRLTLEALYIREIKPSLNTKDEYRNRELRIRF